MSREQFSHHEHLKSYHPEVVSFLGPGDSFSAIIASRVFRPDYTTGAVGGPREFRAHPRLRDVIDDTRSDHHAIGVLPVENKLTSPVHEVTDALLDGDLHVLGEAWLGIRLVVAGTGRFDDIETLYSYTKALDQAKKFVAQHELKVVEVDSTSAAATIVAESKDTTIAALCSLTAARSNKLNIMRHSVQDDPNNRTRFLFVQSSQNPRSNPDIIHLESDLRGAREAKIAALVSPKQPTIKHGWTNVGACFKDMGIVADEFAHRNTQAQPVGGDRDHFVELSGKPFALRDAMLLSENRQNLAKVASVKVLGVYPVASTRHPYDEDEFTTVNRSKKARSR